LRCRERSGAPSPQTQNHSLFSKESIESAARRALDDSPSKDRAMAWQRLQDWLVGRSSFTVDETMPLTLVTLTAKPTAESEEMAFYRNAEFEMLVEWARMGRFILALNAVDRNELTLLCVENLDEMTAEVQRLPLVAAGLACSDIRVVMPLQFLNISKPSIQ
jgi:hypothetical protein